MNDANFRPPKIEEFETLLTVEEVADALRVAPVTVRRIIAKSEIERVLFAHPAVQDCAVVGVPDDKWGEAVAAFVQVKAGCTVTEEALIALCRERLGAMKTPKLLSFRDELPRSPVGKILKRELREPFWAAGGRKV